MREASGRADERTGQRRGDEDAADWVGGGVWGLGGAFRCLRLWGTARALEMVARQVFVRDEFAIADLDQDGKVSFDEFVEYYNSLVDRLAQVDGDAHPKPNPTFSIGTPSSPPALTASPHAMSSVVSINDCLYATQGAHTLP